MLHKLIPAITTAEKKTITSASAEHQRLVNLGTRYQRPHAMQGVMAPPHPLHLALDEALQVVAAHPTEENITAALDAANRRAALTEGIASSIGGAVYSHIDSLRASLAPIAGRLVTAARESFESEATARRAALPSGEAAGVILEDPSGALEGAIATARSELETEIADFQSDPLASLPPLCES